MVVSTKLHSSLRLAKPQVLVEQRRDGTQLLRSPVPLQSYGRAVGEWLAAWAERAPERTFLAERDANGDDWRRLCYRDALEQARAIGQALLDRKLDPSRPIVVLSGNSIDHALLALGAMHVGLAVAPISPAYSLMSRAFGKLKQIFELLDPQLVWTADPQAFGPALEAVEAKATPLTELVADRVTSAVDDAFGAIRPDTLAKVLFTSGSTGTPKGVINTHGMIVANQQQSAQVWPFVNELSPVVVDWLPWNHTFGGNYNFFLILSSGGTMYLDEGKPAPGLVEATVRNLREISPNLYFNVPRGFDLLMPYLERDQVLRRSFFRELRFVFYAGAALAQNLWERFERLALAERDGDLALVSAWGATETAPLVAAVHWSIDRAGVIGLPVPGCELKLVPSGDKLEARVKGPNVTPGYYRQPQLTSEAFDDEGFYRIGDALRYGDPADPAKGLVFDGRIAEDFKLSSGTWVNVGAVRVRLIAAADPLIQDAVITGHDRAEVGALVFLNPVLAQQSSDEEIRSRLSAALRTLSKEGGSSMHPTRLLVAREPLSIDANEITDKGYVNQRAVVERRAERVELLHAVQPGPEVIIPTNEETPS